VSVLFADLVGFTPLAEAQDAEEVRDVLSRYFETAGTVIGRYGGTVEKFIGDAVMAVWGAPVAREDDAERAVRTALDLVSDIAALGAEIGIPGLRLRAGVATGEAAVTVGAQNQGIVAGDLVNTASRIQSVAPPGGVLVDEPTRRAVQAAVVCEEAGTNELKGKAEPVALWRAVRVIAARRGEGRFVGLEPPFVGREAELRLLKDLFHATEDDRRARLLSVVGVAGIGKSRLAWEFEKYVDGLIDEVWWHRGRCLAYGEGVAYWALAEMVRMRAAITEDEEATSALAKLAAMLADHVPDPGERAWIEPRLRHLLGLTDRMAPDREDLFSAWRLLFERLAEQGPAVLLFEDLHWADAGLLDFIEYLLDWSRSFPIFVVALTRPELLERRPNWGAGARSFHSIILEPLPKPARDELLEGLVPGLPADVRAQIRERAEGIPLYAVETVRMLIDRGLLSPENGGYRLTGPVEALDVPETLHALIAARLDGLPPAERRVLEDASVLGRTFAKRALAAVCGFDERELEPLLSSLVAKEILVVEVDPRSPERGQHGFLHALFQKVAYDTLSRKERKERHLRVAAQLESRLAPDEEELAEVIASHYLEAYRATPDADDAVELRVKAGDRLRAAAERAASLAANEEARRYFDQAAELAEAPLVKAELLERAGSVALVDGLAQEAETRFDQALALFEAEGDAHAAARVSARYADVIFEQGRLEEAIGRMERSFEVLSGEQPDADLAALAAQLARLHFFSGETARAAERVELALETAEALDLPELVSQALNTKAMMLVRRPHESQALIREALQVALEHDLPAAALRAYYNISFLAATRGSFADALDPVERGLALARRRGDRAWEWRMLLAVAETLYQLGRWDEALARIAEMPSDRRPTGSFLFVADSLAGRIHLHRGELDEAVRDLAPFEAWDPGRERQAWAHKEFMVALLRRVRGELESAVEQGERAFESYRALGNPTDAVDALAESVAAALELGEVDSAGRLVALCDDLTRVERTFIVEAQATRLRGVLAAARGQLDSAEQQLEAAGAHFRELGLTFWLAASLLELGEVLVRAGRGDEAARLLAEAREIFESLKARPWLERLDRAGAPVAEAAR
jgi:class 3 adenylate cyclase/tetratricopeptide (TPR) repeat protein